jgi:hypothetical protein
MASDLPWSNRALGLDWAKWQGLIPVDACVRAGVEFMIGKATDGVNKDPAFAANWIAMRGKTVRGAYGWLHPDGDPVGQAEALVRAAPLEDNDLPYIVDFEEPETTLRGTALVDRLRAMVRRIQQIGSRTVIIYTGRWYWAQYCLNVAATDLGALPCWHAEYPFLGVTGSTSKAYKAATSKLTKPSPALPWSTSGNVIAWQFDGNGGLVLPSGVDADFNVADLAELRALAASRAHASNPPDTIPDSPAPIRRSSQSMAAVRPDEPLAVPERPDLTQTFAAEDPADAAPLTSRGSP